MGPKSRKGLALQTTVTIRAMNRKNDWIKCFWPSYAPNALVTHPNRFGAVPQPPLVLCPNRFRDDPLGGGDVPLFIGCRGLTALVMCLYALGAVG